MSRCNLCDIRIGKKRKSAINCEHLFCFRCIETRYACPLCKTAIETIQFQDKTIVRAVYVINYDFGKHWTSKIVPFLDHPAVQQAVRECAERYKANFDIIIQYDPRTPLASYSNTDAYCMIMDRHEEIFLEQHPSVDFTGDGSDADYDYEAREKFVAPLHDWDKIKHNLESFYIVGGCYWFAPTVMLTLARLVEPGEQRMIRESEEHATVVNRQHTHVFDLIYWGLDGRLEHYLFGDPIERHDESLGGKVALVASEE